MTAAPRADHGAEIRAALAMLVEPDNVYELRIPKAGRDGTVAGYFADRDALADAVVRWDGKAPGLYLTLNPVNPALLARAANRAKPHAEQTTSDADVLYRRRMMIDLDPVRPSGIASTDAEHEAAIERAREVHRDLRATGWPAPLVIDSGNGARLDYAIDLANDDESLTLVKRVLEALAFRYDDDAVRVDTTVANAARIARIPGTLNCKGDDTADRPHRRSRVLRDPGPLVVVTREQLEALAATMPVIERPKGNGAASDFNVEQWITDHGIEVLRESSWQGGRRWLLRACPFNADHTNGSAAILQHASGAIVFKCQHDGCADRDWRALREQYEPGAYARGGDAAAPEADVQRARLTTLSAIERRDIKWLWEGRIPLGKISIIDGDPGLGKSHVTLDLAGRVSRGLPMPDGSAGVVGGVVLLTYEDDAGDTVRPRVEAAGGDLERIHMLSIIEGTEYERMPDLPGDLALIEQAIIDTHAVLVVVDPIMAALSGKVDSHRDQDVRRVLAPLAKIAERTGVAIVMVRHLNKGGSGSAAIYRGGGSIGIVGAARSGLLVARDPDDPDRRVLAVVKSNLAAPAPALGFRIVEANGGTVVEWLGTVTATADELVSQPTGAEERSAADEAKAFLRDYLDVSPRPAADVKRAARGQGIADRTLDRAKFALGIVASKQGFGDGGAWVWSLPATALAPLRTPTPPKSATPPTPENVASLGNVGALRAPADLGTHEERQGGRSTPTLAPFGDAPHEGRQDDRSTPTRQPLETWRPSRDLASFGDDDAFEDGEL